MSKRQRVLNHVEITPGRSSSDILDKFDVMFFHDGIHGGLCRKEISETCGEEYVPPQSPG